MTSIGSQAFYECNSLKTMTIKVNKDLEIGKNIFEKSSLEELIMSGETLPKSADEDFADGFYDTTTLYVPFSQYEEYHSTSPWSKFKNIVIIDVETTGISNQEPWSPNASSIYNINGGKVGNSTLNSGLYIKKGKKYVVKQTAI